MWKDAQNNVTHATDREKESLLTLSLLRCVNCSTNIKDNCLMTVIINDRIN